MAKRFTPAVLAGDPDERAAAAAKRLAELGDITTRKMFGGVGIFVDAKMFVILDKEGGVYFKCDDSNVQRYLDIGSRKHGMPYYQVPADVWVDDDAMLEWARLSADIARS